MNRLAFFLLLANGSACAAAFLNGSFENPVVANFDAAAVPTGWTKFDTGCGVDNCPGVGVFMQTYSAFALPPLPGGGFQAVGFGGNGNIGSSVRQTFDTVAGHTYQVSFFYVIQQGGGFEDWIAEVLNGATPLTSQSQLFNNQAWQNFTFNFVAASASSTLRFTDNSGAVSPADSNGTNWGLDLVTVTDLTAPPATAPEPADLLLIATGLAAVAAIRRFRPE